MNYLLESTPHAEKVISFFKEAGFLRKLKRCPRKATARSENQHSSYVGIYSFSVLSLKQYKI
ncbi:hypothetical protein GH741_04510 [Aquibacillus halophilus]|uniref:Uncharacterized protein n=1 Tax=Aquibacillus halophilus TaxID=930132 RepID=A0A6A8DBM3_9BACI|nr:hypothetical protein [Aquibacillus halophilus]MRH41936.1 hypothetical protein [Aquibacillus halophilus]